MAISGVRVTNGAYGPSNSPRPTHRQSKTPRVGEKKRGKAGIRMEADRKPGCGRGRRTSSQSGKPCTAPRVARALAGDARVQIAMVPGSALRRSFEENFPSITTQNGSIPSTTFTRGCGGWRCPPHHRRARSSWRPYRRPTPQPPRTRMKRVTRFLRPQASTSGSHGSWR